MKNELYSLTEHQYELIFKFYDGSLNPSRRKEFDQQMFNDEFKQAVRQYSYLQSALTRELEDDELHLELKNVAKKFHESPDGLALKRKMERPLTIKPRFIKLAASFLLMAIIGTVIWANLKYTNSAIAQAFQDPLLSNIVMSNELQDQIFRSGRQDFFDGKYQKAEAAMILIPEQDIHYPEAQVLLAYCNFYQKKYDTSLVYFDRLLNQLYSQLPEHYKSIDKLRWSRLLVLLGLEQESTSLFKQELLYFLEGNSEYYSTKAHQLNNTLQNPIRKVVIE